MTSALNPNGKLQMLKVDADGALIVAGGVSGGSAGNSNTTEATQLLVKAAVQSIDADIGAPADAAASSDTGTFSLIALLKRGLGNWTSLLGRIPALVGGRIPVDASGAIQLGGGALTATTQRVTLASDGPSVANLASIDAKTPALVGGRLPVDNSGAIQLGVGIATATTQRVTLASDGPEVTNSTAMVAKLTSVDNKTPSPVNGRRPVDIDRVVKRVIDAASATVTYVCEASAVGTATSAAGWRIKRITVSGTVTTIQWGGTGAFDQIADNRATSVVYA